MKAKNLLEGLERYDGYAVCPGCQGCEGKKVIACRDLIWQAAARIRGQERQIECLMAANEGHRRMLVELHQRLAKAELGWISTEEAQPCARGTTGCGRRAGSIRFCRTRRGTGHGTRWTSRKRRCGLSR